MSEPAAARLTPPPPAHLAALPPARIGAAGTRVLSGVPYAALPGARPLELDLILPPAGGPTAPLVVFLHGGGWRLGSRHSAGPAFTGADPTPFERVARAGVAVASIDYRLTGEAIWPAQLHDAKAAVRWLRARSGEIGTDPDRIGVWGESAGGHLAQLLALTGEVDSLAGDVGLLGPSSRVTAAVAWYAPSDLAAIPADTGTDPHDGDSREARLLGGPAVEVPLIAAQAAPINHVSGQAPPLLLLHGQDDLLVPCVQSRRLHDALAAVGAHVELHTYEGAGHLWAGAPEAAQDALRRSITFLRERLDT